MQRRACHCASSTKYSTFNKILVKFQNMIGWQRSGDTELTISHITKLSCAVWPIVFNL